MRKLCLYERACLLLKTKDPKIVKITMRALYKKDQQDLRKQEFFAKRKSLSK
ncbi:MAG: hypothetical protein RSB72_01475 [Bacilli bacterium]